MSLGASDLPNKESGELAKGLASIESGREYHRVSGAETIPVEELPVFLKLADQALAIINPTTDLGESELEGQTRLNPEIGVLLIDPKTFNIDQNAGYKGLANGIPVPLGRNHSLRRFQPFPQSVSGNHASITTSPDGTYVTVADLHSSNGTFLARRHQDILKATAEQLFVSDARGASLASESHPDRNEDAYVVDPVHNVYAIFDGLSSDEEATVASQAAAQAVSKIAHENVHPFTSEDAATSYLRTSMYRINDSIRATTDARTTGIVAKLHHMQGRLALSVAHVGDSRAYILRNEKLISITIDHSAFRPQDDAEAMAQQERLADAITPTVLSEGEAAIYEGRNIVGAYLGKDATVRQDIHHFAVKSGDTLLLTSDGVHDNLTTSEIQMILNNPEITDYASALNTAARERSKIIKHYRRKRDDMTAVVVKI